jgi:DNA mismatch repair protein MutS
MKSRSAAACSRDAEPMQMTIFTPLSQRIVDRIAETDINSLTPLQALNLLEELKQELGETATPAARSSR